MKTVEGKLSFEITDAEGKKTSVERDVTYPEYESVEDVLTTLQSANPDQIKAFLSALNYGINLKARAARKSQLQTEFAGPGKAIEQMVKGLMKMGLSEEKARKKVLAMLSED